MRRHQRLGELIGAGLLVDDQVRITVNRAGDQIQLVRMGTNFRAEAELVPPDDRNDITGWIRAAERAWNLHGREWRFESVQQARAAWQSSAE